MYGMKHCISSFNTRRVCHIYYDLHVEHQNFLINYGDLTDSSCLILIMQEVQPCEVYNLGVKSRLTGDI